MITWVANKLRGRLNASARRSFRRFADMLLFPIGSIKSGRAADAAALTFDDGPDGEVTPRLLDLLRARGVKATFFVLTDKAQTHPQLVRRLVEDGHEVALHFDRHDRLTRLPLGVVRQRLVAALRSLEALAGPVRFFRPPFGAQSLGTYLLARSQGLQVVSWGPAAEDWVEQTPAAAADRALSTMKGGDVVLLHDGLEMPPEDTLPTFDRVRMVELLLDGMAARGIRPTTVGSLVAAGGPQMTAWFRL